MMVDSGLSPEVDDLADLNARLSDDNLFLAEALKLVIEETYSELRLQRGRLLPTLSRILIR